MLLVNLYIYSNQYKVFSLKEEIEGLLENADLLSEVGEASVLSLFSSTSFLSFDFGWFGTSFGSWK